jgi:hypothetical protein
MGRVYHFGAEEPRPHLFLRSVAPGRDLSPEKANAGPKFGFGKLNRPEASSSPNNMKLETEPLGEDWSGLNEISRILCQVVLVPRPEWLQYAYRVKGNPNFLGYDSVELVFPAPGSHARHEDFAVYDDYCELTLSFDEWHTHSYGDEMGGNPWLEWIDEILDEKQCAVSLYTRSGPKVWLLLPTEEAINFRKHPDVTVGVNFVRVRSFRGTYSKNYKRSFFGWREYAP